MFLEFMRSVSFIKKIEEKIEEESDLIIPDEHKNIVRERIRKSEADPERLLDWDEVKDTFILD